jgi:hypothetical protein
MPDNPDGTSHRVLSPAPASNGCEDQTYAVARDADVTQLFCAVRDTSLPSRMAVPTGAQK